MKGESYRTKLTNAEKDYFRKVCREENVDPKVSCPLCGGHRLTRTMTYRYDDDAKDFMDYATQVDCHSCEIRYSVLVQNPVLTIHKVAS